MFPLFLEDGGGIHKRVVIQASILSGGGIWLSGVGGEWVDCDGLSTAPKGIVV